MDYLIVDGADCYHLPHLLLLIQLVIVLHFVAFARLDILQQIPASRAEVAVCHKCLEIMQDMPRVTHNKGACQRGIAVGVNRCFGYTIGDEAGTLDDVPVLPFKCVLLCVPRILLIFRINILVPCIRQFAALVVSEFKEETVPVLPCTCTTVDSTINEEEGVLVKHVVPVVRVVSSFGQFFVLPMVDVDAVLIVSVF